MAGATISSDAAKKAVQAALDQAAGDSQTEKPETTQAASDKAASNTAGDYKAGSYEGTAQGFGGEVKAKVVIGDAGIESVELTGDGETPALGGEALKTLAPAFKEAGSADVDAVAGATVSSDAAKKAVQAALDQAK